MAQIFEKYPELMLYDATYKMNNMDMPLIIQLCVDGNGETEICSLFFARSESYLSVGCMVDAFQSFNPAWTRTEVILGDKDFADRAIYAEKYPNAVLHEELNINCVKKYLDKKTFKYIRDEIERLQGKPYACSTCTKKLSGLQIMCERCLDWHHAKCVGFTASLAKNTTFFCTSC